MGKHRIKIRNNRRLGMRRKARLATRLFNIFGHKSLVLIRECIDDTASYHCARSGWEAGSACGERDRYFGMRKEARSGVGGGAIGVGGRDREVWTESNRLLLWGRECH